MTLHVTIFTHRRPEMLRDLLADLELNETKFTKRIYHDGPKPSSYQGIDIIEMKPQHGKKGFHKLFNAVLKDLPPADLYLFLPDDIRIEPNGLDKLIQEWSDIDDPQKALYNCLNDRGRTGLPNWTNRHGQPHNINSLQTYWWDLCGFITPGFVQILKRNPVIVNPERWRWNPHSSSGVGEYISKLAIEAKSIYQTRNGYIEHIGHISKMNTNARRNEPLTSWTLEPIIAGMATVAGRDEQSTLAMASLANQVDRLYVVFNNCEISQFAMKHPNIIPLKGNNKIGDGEKFRGLDIAKKEFESFYFLSVDDDIIYPQDYVWRMVHKIEQRNRETVCTVHGKILPEKTARFYGSHIVMHHTKSENNSDKIVNCIGSGTAAWHSSTLDFSTEYIKAANMADIWLSKACYDQGRQIIAVSRIANWLKVLDVKGTIYEKHHKSGTVQTKHWNEIFKKS